MKKYSNILADERPEFKAANYGFDTLSNTELLSMIINRGAGTTESLSQARQLMNIADGSLSNLSKLSMDEMQVVQGIGDCKALAVLEQAHLLLMNQNFRLIKHVKISEGGLTETSVDIRIIMQAAVKHGATIMAFAHNHPSHNAMPSRADDQLTMQIKKACEIMRIFFMDYRHHGQRDGNTLPFHLLANLLITADEGRG